MFTQKKRQQKLDTERKKQEVAAARKVRNIYIYVFADCDADSHHAYLFMNATFMIGLERRARNLFGRNGSERS